MGDSAPIDPRIELAGLFDNRRCPNLALIVRRTSSIRVVNPAAYINALDSYSDFLNSMEHSIGALVDERDDTTSRGKVAEANFQTIAKERDFLKKVIEQQHKLLEEMRSLSAMSSGKNKKRLAADPPSKFDARDGTYHKIQESYEIWESKIIGVFDRDLDYFDTPKLRIGYIADQCDGKAFQFISDHVTAFRRNPDDPNLKFNDWQAMLKFMRNQYPDIFFQKNRNYWSWKQELDELFVKAKKTPEQKVDLLKTRVNDKINDMFVTLDVPPRDNDYEGGSKKADRFARNLEHRDYLAKLEKSALHSQNNLTQNPRTRLLPAPADTGDPMDLSAAQYSSPRLPQEVLDYRRATGVCLACGEPGYAKSAHRYDPQANPHPLPMSQRTAQSSNFGSHSRGRENFTPSPQGRGGFRGNSSSSRGRSSYTTQPRPQVYQP
ncbi:hypothetical protein N657DRAFT_647729 [Parathielavia appendiculata]|uniref:Uncharacterized protein n=1 Tax=Parathielavia appendiculata TaxID=2587402 RepID=A0AAN6TWM5_9PEZI|nr:hypothetical protein N657DRAFT_647729 [Parathielavia appendiculata]